STFAGDVTAGKPSNHLATSAPCVQWHTTTGDYTQYSSPGTHQEVTGCLSCHGSTVAGTFSIAANPVFSILTVPANHIRFGTADCNGSGCHSTSNVNPGGRAEERRVGNVSSQTLTAAGHTR